MSRRRTLVAAGAVAGAAAVGAGVWAARRSRAGRAADEPGELDELEGAERISIPTDDGAVLDGLDVGEGPLVVLAHGWLCNRSFWYPVARRLVASGHRVLVYEQRGHGRSTDGDTPATMARLGDDIAAVLAAVDADDAVLVGHSMGGMASQAYVIDHPDDARRRLRGLVLLNTSAAEVNKGMGQFSVRVVGDPRVERLMRSPAGVRLMRSTMGRRATTANLALTRDGFVGTPGAVRSAHLRAMKAMDHRERLSGVPLPTTVIVGTRDTLTPPRQGRLIARLVPGARLVEVPGAGHMIHLEDPDLVVQEVEVLTAEPSSTTGPSAHAGTPADTATSSVTAAR